MSTQAYRDGLKQIDWSNFQPRQRQPQVEPQRSSLPCPMVINDNMPIGHHPHDGKAYTSKSAWRAANRAGGYVEVGNDPSRLSPRQKPQADRGAIRASLERAKSRINA